MNRRSRAARLIELAIPRHCRQVLDEVTGQLCDASASDQSECSLEDNLFLEEGSSGSGFRPETEQSLSISSDQGKRRRSFEEILNEETGQISRTEKGSGRAKKRRRKGCGDRSQWKRVKNADAT